MENRGRMCKQRAYSRFCNSANTLLETGCILSRVCRLQSTYKRLWQKDMASQRRPSFHCITKIKEAKSDYLPHGSLSSFNWAGMPGNDLLSHYPRIFGILITASLWTGAGIKRALISGSRPLSVHLTFIFLLLFGYIPDPRTQTNKLS